MKPKRTKWFVLMFIVATMVFVSACGGAPGDKTDSDTSNGTISDSSSEGNTEPGKSDETSEGNTEPGKSDETDDPYFGKYDPPIEVTFVRSVDDTVQTNVLDRLDTGETIEDNRWLQLYREQLGIDIKYLWIAKGTEQYTQKLNVAIASGELPDFMSVNSSQLKQLAEANMIMDLTDIYEKHATPMLKETMEQDDSVALKAATFDGKLMGLPTGTGTPLDNAALLWIRTDWLEKLNLSEPKNMDDLLKIIEAFTNDDPNGNGKKDEIGLAIVKDLWGGYAGLEGFFNGYHAYPNIWIEDESGNLVYGSIQPEIKTALAKLQELYKMGAIDPEFGAKDAGKVAEDVGAGRSGLNFGHQWNPLWPFQSSKDNDPKAQWKAFPIVSIDEQPARPQVQMGTTSWTVAKKGIKHPEALVKLYNLHLEKNWGESEEFEKYYLDGDVEGVWKLSPVTPSVAFKNLKAYLELEEARKTNDFSNLSPEPRSIWKMILDYEQKGKGVGWGWERIYGPESSYTILNQYNEQNLCYMDKFVGAPTPTMVEKKATLDALQLEIFTKIILNDVSIDEFDKFVKNWKQLGGDAITAEVNEWYADFK